MRARGTILFEPIIFRGPLLRILGATYVQMHLDRTRTEASNAIALEPTHALHVLLCNSVPHFIIGPCPSAARLYHLHTRTHAHMTSNKRSYCSTSLLDQDASGAQPLPVNPTQRLRTIVQAHIERTHRLAQDPEGSLTALNNDRTSFMQFVPHDVMRYILLPMARGPVFTGIVTTNTRRRPDIDTPIALTPILTWNPHDRPHKHDFSMQVCAYEFMIHAVYTTPSGVMYALLTRSPNCHDDFSIIKLPSVRQRLQLPGSYPIVDTTPEASFRVSIARDAYTSVAHFSASDDGSSFLLMCSKKFIYPHPYATCNQLFAYRFSCPAPGQQQCQPVLNVGHVEAVCKQYVLRPSAPLILRPFPKNYTVLSSFALNTMGRAPTDRRPSRGLESQAESFVSIIGSNLCHQSTAPIPYDPNAADDGSNDNANDSDRDATSAETFLSTLVGSFASDLEKDNRLYALWIRYTRAAYQTRSRAANAPADSVHYFMEVSCLRTHKLLDTIHLETTPQASLELLSYCDAKKGRFAVDALGQPIHLLGNDLYVWNADGHLIGKYTLESEATEQHCSDHNRTVDITAEGLVCVRCVDTFEYYLLPFVGPK